MQPKHALVIALLCGAGGFAVARLVAPGPDTASPPPATDAAEPWFDSTRTTAERLEELERAVSEERQARLLLEEELLVLRDTVDALAPPGEREMLLAATADVEDRVPDDPRRGRRGGRDSTELRIERLESAGFSPARAAWIVERESQRQFDMLKARHEVERGGDIQAYRDAAASYEQNFREELGDADYERYLEGTGRSTAVDVSSVMDASPARAAGLRPGDRILSYAGQRVYNMGDLNRLTLEGRAGEVVYVEIERDGMPMQIALPRGPVGITGGGRRPQ